MTITCPSTGRKFEMTGENAHIMPEESPSVATLVVECVCGHFHSITLGIKFVPEAIEDIRNERRIKLREAGMPRALKI
jgi:hypothetical protein